MPLSSIITLNGFSGLCVLKEWCRAQFFTLINALLSFLRSSCPHRFAASFFLSTVCHHRPSYWKFFWSASFTLLSRSFSHDKKPPCFVERLQCQAGALKEPFLSPRSRRVGWLPLTMMAMISSCASTFTKEPVLDTGKIVSLFRKAFQGLKFTFELPERSTIRFLDLQILEGASHTCRGYMTRGARTWWDTIRATQN